MQSFSIINKKYSRLSLRHERGAEFPSWKLAALIICVYITPLHRLFCKLYILYYKQQFALLKILILSEDIQYST
jgi:hypothetical protein